jgi:hypothetical protein
VEAANSAPYLHCFLNYRHETYTNFCISLGRYFINFNIGPPSLLSIVYRRLLKWPGREADCLSPSSADIKNVWLYTSNFHTSS